MLSFPVISCHVLQLMLTSFSFLLLSQYLTFCHVWLFTSINIVAPKVVQSHIKTEQSQVQTPLGGKKSKFFALLESYFFYLTLSFILISCHLHYSYEHRKGELLVSDLHTHFFTYNLSPSSQHQFLTISVTNFHEVPWLLSFVISCQHCHFLSSAVITFCCCLLPFLVLTLSHSLTFCLVLLLTQ